MQKTRSSVVYSTSKTRRSVLDITNKDLQKLVTHYKETHSSVVYGYSKTRSSVIYITIKNLQKLFIYYKKTRSSVLAIPLTYGDQDILTISLTGTEYNLALTEDNQDILVMS